MKKYNNTTRINLLLDSDIVYVAKIYGAYNDKNLTNIINEALEAYIGSKVIKEINQLLMEVKNA